ncbi:hypothetical protein ACTFBW_03180 [Aeromonas rivipollensis]
MEMNKYGMSAVALLGALLLGNSQAQASETLNTILGGGSNPNEPAPPQSAKR